MKLILFILIIIHSLTNAKAQLQAHYFGKLAPNKVEQGEAIIVNSDHSKIVLYNQSYNSNASEWTIEKTNASGGIIWAHTFQHGNNGLSNYLNAEAMVQLPTGEIIVLGDSILASIVPVDAYLFMAKFNAQGQHLWTKYVHHTNPQTTHHFLNAHFEVQANKILDIAESNIYTIDTSGQVTNQISTPSYTFSGELIDSAHIFSVGGSSPSSIYSFDAQLNIKQSNALSFTAQSITSYQNHLYVGGYKHLGIGSKRDIVVAKLDTSLNTIWQKQFTKGDYTNSKAIKILNGEVWVAAEMKECENTDTLTVCYGDLSVIILNLNSNTGDEIKTLYYTDSLFASASGLDSGFQCTPNYMHVINNTFYVMGSRRGFSRFPSILHGFFQSDNNYGDALLLEYTTPSGVQSVNSEIDIVAYPNPFSDQLNILNKTPLKITSLFLKDIQGRKVIEMKNPGSIINVSGLKPGIYFLEAQTSMNHYFKKIIKQ